MILEFTSTSLTVSISRGVKKKKIKKRIGMRDIFFLRNKRIKWII